MAPNVFDALEAYALVGAYVLLALVVSFPLALFAMTIFGESEPGQGVGAARSPQGEDSAP